MKWKCYIKPGVKRSWAYWDEWDRAAFEAVQCANISFASDRFLFISRRVASFHLGAGNSRLLLTDKFNLNLQYCMLGMNKCLFFLFLKKDLWSYWTLLTWPLLGQFRILSSFPIQPLKFLSLAPMGFPDGIGNGFCILNFNTKAYMISAYFNYIAYKIKESLSWRPHERDHYVLKIRCSYC